MTYQYHSLSVDHAKTVLDSLRQGGAPNPGRFVETVGSGELFDCDDLPGLAKELLQLWEDVEGLAADAQFESSAAPLIHARLELPEAIAGNREFWTWFTFVAADGYFLEVAKKRFQRGPVDRRGLLADDVNFGIVTKAQLYEGLFARLWWRGHRFYDETADDPYDIARRGYIDLWRSHILRQDYGASRTMSRALIEYLFPGKAQISGHDKTLVRELPKLVRAQNAVTAFELLSLDECKNLLEELAVMVPKHTSDED